VPTGLFVLPSPLLGSGAYAPLLEELRRTGHRADVGVCDEPIRVDRLVGAWTEASRDADTEVLIAHSNAGYLAPTVSQRLGGRPVVFMDAALPPESGPTRLAPAAFREFLGTLAGPDGRLPPWTRWWPGEEMSEVLPEPWFRIVDEHAPRADLTYFDTEFTPPEGWSGGSAAYLAFGTTYAEEIAFARTAGWPVVELEEQHLHHLTHPEETGAAILRLVGRIGDRSA
jgi:hypothetical protein